MILFTLVSQLVIFSTFDLIPIPIPIYIQARAKGQGQDQKSSRVESNRMEQSRADGVSLLFVDIQYTVQVQYSLPVYCSTGIN